MTQSRRHHRRDVLPDLRFLGEQGILPAKARDNPFRVERIHTFRYRPLDISWDELLQRFQQSGYRGAIVGPEGSGKTTLLEDVAARLAASGQSSRWLQVRFETRRDGRQLVADFLHQARADDVLLVDGVEQLGPLTWRKLRRRSLAHAGLLITTHAPGRLPTLLESRTTLALLEQIVAELAPADFDRLRPELSQLFARHSGNVRSCLRELYDRFAERVRSFNP